MHVRNRLKMIRIIEKIERNKEFSVKIGIENKSKISA